MVTTALLISNIEEVMESKQKMEKLGIGELVKPVYVEREFCFPLSAMVFAFRNDEGNIKVVISNQEIILKYDKEIYDRIKEHFKHL